MTRLSLPVDQHLTDRPVSSGLRSLSRTAHLVGIGGTGMKALAELLTSAGWVVTGSDQHGSSSTMRAMRRRGWRVHSGHHDRFVPRHADLLVHSPAVGPSNPERRMAERLGIPQYSYSEMLGCWMQSRTGIAIAGTHGKSTTTAMVACILADAGRSPSVVIGAPLCERNVSGWSGESDLFVVESCEYQRSFCDLGPKFAAILSVEPDHFDCYRTTEEMTDAFAQFAAQVASDGQLLVRSDCPHTARVLRDATAEVETFSLQSGADWWAADLKTTREGLRFRVFHHGRYFSELYLPLFGEHNALNALAATAVCARLDVGAAEIRHSLMEFPGIRRRFEIVGSYRGMTLIDDYAHHPTAVRATLNSARGRFGSRRIWCIFQPHQISRTEALLNEFSRSFQNADETVITPVYAAREEVDSEPETVSRRLTQQVARQGVKARFCAALDHIIATLDDEARPGDVIITMGAGDIDQVHHELTRRLCGDPQARRAVG